MSVCTSTRREDNIIYCEDTSWKTHVFKNRFEAGEKLALYLLDQGIGREYIVFGLVAGGVPVAYSVAKTIGSPMDILVVKKITYPWTTEAGFGAVTVDGSYDYDAFAAYMYLRYSDEQVARLAKHVHEYVLARTRRLRKRVEYERLDGRRVVLVDDGIATGYTMVVGVRFLKKLGASSVIAAAPTASSDGAKLVAREADKVVVLNLRHPPYAVADAYEEWHDVSDEEVLEILEQARREKLYL